MRAQEFVSEKWSSKYKKSINCASPRGFSQKAHCAGRKKNEDVAEGSEQKYLWHGSRQKIPMLEPRQSVDTGGAAGSNQNAIYATSDPKVAIAVGGLTTPDSDTAMFPNDPQMVLFSGKIRKGENVYLHKLPFYSPDGKPQFVQGAHDREFYSIPGVKGIKPTEIKAVSVDKYLDLIRKATPADLELRKKNMKEQGVAEGLTETRNSLFAFVKQQFPTWPDYVLKDFLYPQAKGIRNQAELDDFLKRNKQDFGNCKWTLTELPITFGIFTPKTQRMIASREGGSSNPFQVPRDAERHAQQSQMIQQKGVSAEPIIVAKLSNGYDLIEGWHRTIQHLKAFPQGYTGPAWVCTGATYKSESVEQGMSENFADGKNPGRKGLSKRVGVNTKASVSDLRKTAKNSSGEKQRMAHWLANMKAGRAKARRKK